LVQCCRGGGKGKKRLFGVKKKGEENKPKKRWGSFRKQGEREIGKSFESGGSGVEGGFGIYDKKAITRTLNSPISEGKRVLRGLKERGWCVQAGNSNEGSQCFRLKGRPTRRGRTSLEGRKIQ